MKQIIKLHLAFIMLIFIDFLIFISPICILFCYLWYNQQQISTLKEYADTHPIIIALSSGVFCIYIMVIFNLEPKIVLPKLRRLMAIKHTIQIEKYKLPLILRLILMVLSYCCIGLVIIYSILTTQLLINGINAINVVLVTTIMFTLCCTLAYYIGNWMIPFIEYLVYLIKPRTDMSKDMKEAAKQYAEIEMKKVLNVRATAECSSIAGAECQKIQSPWISVNERLPASDDDLYLALDIEMNPPGCDICDFNPQSKKWTDCKGCIVFPTHWMPIPKFN